MKISISSWTYAVQFGKYIPNFLQNNLSYSLAIYIYIYIYIYTYQTTLCYIPENYVLTSIALRSSNVTAYNLKYNVSQFNKYLLRNSGLCRETSFIPTPKPVYVIYNFQMHRHKACNDVLSELLSTPFSQR
jgi:hypothetical protein